MALRGDWKAVKQIEVGVCASLARATSWDELSHSIVSGWEGEVVIELGVQESCLHIISRFPSYVPPTHLQMLPYADDGYGVHA